MKVDLHVRQRIQLCFSFAIVSCRHPKTNTNFGIVELFGCFGILDKVMKWVVEGFLCIVGAFLSPECLEEQLRDRWILFFGPCGVIVVRCDVIGRLMSRTGVPYESIDNELISAGRDVTAV